MTYHTPKGWAARATFTDPAADHQIRLNARRIVRFAGNSEAHSTAIMLGCSCGWNGGDTKTAEEALGRYRARHYYRPVLEYDPEATETGPLPTVKAAKTVSDIAITMIVTTDALDLAADPAKTDDVALELGRILLMGARAILADMAAGQNGHIDSPDDIERLIRGDNDE